MVGWPFCAPFFYFRLVWLVCDDGGVAGAWVLISAKQCVSVSDCVVFVREMGRSVSVLLDADFICDTVRVRWGRLPIRLCWVCDGGVAGAWVLISAKQCVSVSDWVVFVREMGRSVGRLSGFDFL